ncbi:MAG: GYF domain-containing protein [Robiginitomaculum sp.]
MNWYVQVDNRAYGPYSEQQMQSFVDEKRVNAHSLISNTPQQGFLAASGYAVFAHWNDIEQATERVTKKAIAVGATAQPFAQIQQPIRSQFKSKPQVQTSQKYPPELVASQDAALSPNADSCIYLIMAEIRSEGAMGFLRGLQSFGAAQRIGDTVWVLRSVYSAEQLRNTLSQSLDRQDRLFILDASNNKTAWFNIGADLDHRIRELWNEDED